VADYTITFDGGCSGNGTSDAQAYGSYHLATENKERLVSRVEFPEAHTNNQAEYNALIAAASDLRATIEKAGRSVEEFTVEIRGDCQVVLQQLQSLQGEKAWKCKSQDLRVLKIQALELLQEFKSVTLVKVPRETCVELLGH
jgi:ribonuclease HI